MHARAISVEDPRDLDLNPVLAVIIKAERLGAALAFIIAGARPDRVHIAPIAFFLRMNFRIAIDFRGRGLEDPRPCPLGKAEHVDGAVHRCLGRLHRVELVMDRASRAGHVVNLVDLDKERERHIVAHQLKAWIVHEVGHI